MIEAGTYYARGTDVEFGFANNKEQVAVRFRIEGGNADGQELAWFGFFTDKSAERTMEALRFCGWETNDLGDISTDVVGRNLVKIVVEHDEYDGKTRAKIAWVNRAGGPLVKNSMDAGQKTDFARRMKALAMKVPAKLAAASNVEAPPATSGSNGAGGGHSRDDDFGGDPGHYADDPGF